MTSILKIAHTPPTAVPPDATVLAAVEAMNTDKVGAAAVVSEGKLVGLFTERDLMLKIVLNRRDPASTPVGEVCARQLITITPDVAEGEALRIMIENHVRHLPVIDGKGGILGMLSIRNVLEDRVEDLTMQLDTLAAYIGADGPGG